jgi:hypothetical protein
MKVKVSIETGKSFDTEINENEKTYNLKKVIAEKMFILPDQQRLVYNGRPLLEDQTFAQQGVKDNSNIIVVVNL